MERTIRWMVFLYVLTVFSFLSSADAQIHNLRVCTPGVTPTNMYIYIARDRGYFAQERMEVEVLAARGLLCITAMMANEIHFTSAPTTFDLMVAGKLKGKVLYNPAKGLAQRFIVAPEIKSFSDLKQKNIAISTFGTRADVLTREILAQHGLEAMKDVLLLQIGTPDVRYAALRTNKVQGALLTGYHVVRAIDEGFRELEYETPPYLSGPLIARDESLTRERSTVSSFVRAAMKGHLFFGQRPEEAIVLMQKVLGVQDKVMARKLYEDEMRRYNPGGRFEERYLRRVIERAREGLKGQGNVGMKDVFDLSIASEVEAELKKAQWKP